jgi:hypothetical protein
MPRLIRTVFLSSVFQELITHRKAVLKAVERMDDYSCVAMERFGARTQPADEYCPDAILKCDLVVFIVGHLYGSCPKGSEQSFTELEYETAVQQRKPRLVFLAHDDFPVPASLREPDAKREKQLAFRARLSEELIRALFNTPDELVELVVTAVRNWEKEDAERRQMGRRLLDLQDDEAQPKLGPGVAKACDRSEQTRQFSLFFNHHLDSPRPQVFFIVGDREDCHDSLIDRLVAEKIEPTLKKKWGENCMSPLRRKLRDWEFSGDRRNMHQMLLAQLFHEFDQGYPGVHYSAQAFYELISDLTNNLDGGGQLPVVVVEHTIFLDRWLPECKALLKWYLSFWAGMPADDFGKRFVIFFSFIYPESLSGGESLDPQAQEIREGQKKDLAGLAHSQRKGCHVKLLPDLPLVSESHVLDWFTHNELFSQDVRLRWLARLFPRGPGEKPKPRRMVEIEPALKEVVNSILQSVDPSQRMPYVTHE